jgi:tetratricopeptide (TPR) repeat protein
MIFGDRFHMLRTAVQCLLFLALATAIASNSFAQQPRQRRLPPSDNISNGLDVLGLWQPESVRAILLLYSGKSLSKSKAEELETTLRKTPEKLDERVVLIGYYAANAKTSSDRARLRNHVLWMIENHPEHPSTAEPSLRDLPDDADGNAQILALWTKNLETLADDVAVLKNAEKFFFAKDPAVADRLIHRIYEKEPTNREWANELAHLYRMFGIPGTHIDDPSERAAEAYKRVLALTRTPAARETLAGDMAEAAFKVGDFTAAAEYAKIYLHGKDRTAPQRANTILGRVALRSGDLTSAKQYLLDSSGPESGKEMSLSGPTMVLAKELLEQGEHDAVLQYLQNCLQLWPRGGDVLQIWIADIQHGKMPNFGNLGF